MAPSIMVGGNQACLKETNDNPQVAGRFSHLICDLQRGSQHYLDKLISTALGQVHELTDRPSKTGGRYSKLYEQLHE